MNLVFANQDDEDDIYPLTMREMAEAQKPDIELNAMADKYGCTTQLVENTKVLCKNGKMVIPTSLNKHNSQLRLLLQDKKSTRTIWFIDAFAENNGVCDWL